MAKILITGGSGLIGNAISQLLIKKGYQPVWLSREAGQSHGIQKFKWDVEKAYIDEKAFEDVEHIIHLAGAGIADKRWTEAYKKEIIDSRTKSSALLFNYIAKHKYPIKTLVGASAIGYYGARQSPHSFSENDFAGADFMARTCVLWEKSYFPFSSLGIRVPVIRTGMVLSSQGGAYKSMLPVFKTGFGAVLGSGKQYFSWIHIDDIAAIFVHALLNTNMNGPYNGAAPGPVTNRDFSKQLAKSLHKPLWLPPVPTFALKLAMGESAVMVTEGLKIDNQKILSSGLNFKFNTLQEALKNLADQ